ncbi:HD domain-containing protein [Croceivirga thetidis]|uniref:HD domain-containing protein n=1 Tax=Croceivirga thetidis TaxID=2721623 RepID=A0ABX1GQM7_9FLAO|nr:HD domain-containing protein [Croceivirga thetidis]NKI32225.1 HD domain-containing protein [Croceivirga thetidis]
MSSTNRLKIFNDPIYGFIGIPNELIYNLLEHPYFQRLRRISQMGLSYLVYPGAHHTRFHHALGSMHLMREAISQLRFKKIEITATEEQGLLAAILLHDIGHGPFSHALEGQLVQGVSHEALSLSFMKELNNEMGGRLDMAISIFQGTHPKKFLNQLVSSQLDMDRLDYLKRDSFFTGVTEGNISSQRLLSMLNVAQGELVVEEKGIYSVEKFLMARRFMYWQVYLHKTSLVAELLLTTVIKRAKVLLANGMDLEGSKTLLHFLSKKENSVFATADLNAFSSLDDYDIISALKAWQGTNDNVLSKLSQMLLNRDLPKIKLKNSPISDDKLGEVADKLKECFGLTESELSYFLYHGEVSNRAYNLKSQNINILRKNGKITDVAKASDHLNLKALAKRVTKYYLAYPTVEA